MLAAVQASNLRLAEMLDEEFVAEVVRKNTLP